jgi:hypothetical protein
MADAERPKPPPTARDPFGTRHSLANVVMIATGLESEPERDLYTVAVYAVKAGALGLLFVGDVLGSIHDEIKLIREGLSRRPPKSVVKAPAV